MKIRLDQYLCQNGYAQSRERAKALIMSGIVFVNEQKVDKAGEMIAEDAKVEVRGHDIGYVSRGGLKLEKGLHGYWRIDRRLYRLYAQKWRSQSVRRGCGLWPAGVEPAHR